ncbi:MAG TPA: LemA family protein [Roseimicrobium sp.]|nr:LemA family protein [Roseimicrobium sp.]
MKKLLIGLGIVAGLVVLLVLIAGGSYNSLVRLQTATDGQWAQVQNVYQRRADLIPNLVGTVSGAANFEKSTLTEITAARASVGQVKLDPSKAPTDAASLAQYDKAQQGISSALSRLLVVVEKYPDLKATANFRDLQAQLEGTENRISVERGRFNDVVQSYNAAIRSFPAVFYAGAFGFKERPYFAAAAGAETAPKVQFDFNAPATKSAK